MSKWLGDYTAGKIVFCPFTTIDGNGAPTTLAGSPAILVYKDDGTTESASTGITLTPDFDGRLGMNMVKIDTSADGAFYVTGHEFHVTITTGTVAGVSVVGYIVGHFSLATHSPLRPATADRTLVVDAAGLGDANAVKLGPTGAGTAQTARDIGLSVLLSNGAGTGQVKLSAGYVAPNWGDVGNPTTVVDLTQTTIKNLDNAPTDSAGVTTLLTRIGGTITINGGRVDANAVYWNGHAVVAENVNGVPKVDVVDWLGTVPATPNTAGVPKVDLTRVDGNPTNDHSATLALKQLDISNTAGPGMSIVSTTDDAVVIVGNLLGIDVVGQTGGAKFVGGSGNADGIAAVKAGAGKDINGTLTRVTLADTLTTYTGNTLQTGDSFVRLGAPVGGSISIDIAAVKTDTGNLVTRITSTLFSGITSLAKWMRAMLRSDAADATALSEINLGGGTYAEASHSQQGAASGGGASAASIWSYVNRTLTGTTTPVTVTGPLVASDVIEIVQGDSYYNADGRALEWTSTSWPDLTGATVVFSAKNNLTTALDIANHAMTVVTPTGTAKVRLELAASDTISLALGAKAYSWDVQATLTNGHVVTLVRGQMTVHEDYSTS